MLEKRYWKALRTLWLALYLGIVIAWALALTYGFTKAVTGLWMDHPESRASLLATGATLALWIVLGWLIPAVLRWIDRRNR